MLGRLIKLEISEPWPLYQIIIGKIILIWTSNDRRTYFLIEDIHTMAKYIVDSRYKGHDISDIFSNKFEVVDVGKPKGDPYIFEEAVDLSKVSYYGIGSIKLYDE